MHIAINSSFDSENSFHVHIGRRSDDRANDLSFALIFLVSPFGENALVQVEEDSVKRFHLTIKDAFHVAVCSQRLFYVSDSSTFCSKLTRLEVVYVFVVVEHETNCGSTSVNLERMSTEHNSF